MRNSLKIDRAVPVAWIAIYLMVFTGLALPANAATPGKPVLRVKHTAIRSWNGGKAGTTG